MVHIDGITFLKCRRFSGRYRVKRYRIIFLDKYRANHSCPYNDMVGVNNRVWDSIQERMKRFVFKDYHEHLVIVLGNLKSYEQYRKKMKKYGFEIEPRRW